MPHFVIIAVDGGAASGKSSTSRLLSERFNLLHVDTGSFYRAVCAELLSQGLATDNLDGIRDAVARLKLSTRLDSRSAQMEINGRVASESAIRAPAVNAAVSHFAAIADVRSALLAYQRSQADFGRAHGFRGLIMEGRDIGSVIFPDADFRFFLHADLAERARRREREGQQDAVAERDRLDTVRVNAPLARANGATDIDSTHLSLEQVVDLISEILVSKLSL